MAEDDVEQGRGLAALMHVSAVAVGLALPLPAWGRKHGSEFVRFHAEEAFRLHLGILLLVVTHVVLHGSIAWVGDMQAGFLAQGYPQPEWSMQMLVVLEYVNLGAGALEVLVAWGLALWGGHWAYRGERRPYFFSKSKPSQSKTP